ncbi:MAG TPA: EAL domain-containing protein [Xanthobacteraceae bacterium]|nr:EAL domain-containing protein [Xanthobacteraceae bacterium]
MLTVSPAGVTEKSRSTLWERARLNVVVLVCVIVAVAIGAVVVAIVSSTRSADEIVLAHERQLIARAVKDEAERALNDLLSVAATDGAIRKIGHDLDEAWMNYRLGVWLRTFADYDFVFVVDSADRLVYAPSTGNRSEAKQDVAREIVPLLDRLRGRAATGKPATPVKRASRIQSFLGRPAITAAVLVAPPRPLTPSAAERTAPAVLAVKLIDDRMLADVDKRLDLRNLRRIGDAQSVPSGDDVYDLKGDDGRTIARIAWTSKRPGADVVKSVVPFVMIALAGFGLLASFVLRYMRRTAATIAAGETRLRHLALHDPLCGLPNRMFFGERLEAMIEQVKNGGPTAAVFYIDLDHFKDVNDTLGHPIGDELIRGVTLRLSRSLRGDDLVARLGGDEFAVLTPSAPDTQAVQAMAGRIISGLCMPYSINGHTIVIGASIGIALIDQRAGGAADIMRYADMALYRAKNEGRHRACIYDSAMDADLVQRKQLENDLRAAIENEALHLVYQPIVNASGEAMIGVEALARWNHPERGEVTPTEFIPIAEHSGLIIELGEWVLRRACLVGKAWPNLTVAVNVSPLQFRRTDFVDVVERILAETEFDPSRLELEVTESTLLGNVDSAEAAMLRLKALGVRLALDDFGTGYSSLLYLRRFPFDKLKIDHSFVRSIEKAADAAAIVHAVVSLGRGLGMKVTAEGVETAEQQLFLRAAGVHSMQGFRFGKPMSEAEIGFRLAKPWSRGTDRDTLAALAG